MAQRIGFVHGGDDCPAAERADPCGREDAHLGGRDTSVPGWFEERLELLKYRLLDDCEPAGPLTRNCASTDFDRALHEASGVSGRHRCGD